MTPPAQDLPLTARERLRWRRAMDSLLIDSIYGKVVRDTPRPDHDPLVAAATLSAGAEFEASIAVG